MPANHRKTAYLALFRLLTVLTLGVFTGSVTASASGDPQESAKAVCLAKTPFDIELPLVAIVVILASAATGFIVWGVMKRTVIRRQNEELRRAREDATTAKTARNRFLANISHELLTPISTIAGINEMAMRENAEDVPKPYFMAMMNYCFDIRNASEMLISLINDLLDMSNIESGRSHLEEQEYDTADMLRSIVKKIRMRSSDKDLKLEVETDELLPCRMYGDSGKITQIISNLLTNAVKYTDAGKIVFSAAIQERENNVCKIRFSVRDTGRGIRAEDIEKIFTAYENLEEKRSSSKQGLGLGLDISRRFAELMGGTLTCESEYGKGSEFILTVSQKMIDQTPIGDFSDYDDGTNKGPYVPQFIAPDADILVADDSRKNIEIIRGLLRDTNVFVSAAASVSECLDKIKDTRFSAVFLDQMMLVTNAEETLAKIRQTDPQLPVYVLTANAASGEMVYTSKGFTGYLSKPIDGMTLERTIMKHIPERMMQEPSDRLAADTSQLMLRVNEISGISVSEGIRNAGGVPSFVSALALFRDTVDANSAVIMELYESGDIRMFTAKIHLLESSAKIIGAMKLSRLADDIEEAAKRDDMDYIDRNLGRLMTEYESYKEKLAGL